MNPQDRIRKFMEPEKRLAWGSKVEFQGTPSAMALFAKCGIPLTPPFAPEDSPGPCSLIGPFARSIAQWCMSDALKGGALCKFLLYDVPEHEGVVYAWIAMAGGQWDSTLAAVAVATELEEMHTRAVAHVKQCNDTDHAQMTADANAWFEFASARGGA